MGWIYEASKPLLVGSEQEDLQLLVWILVKPVSIQVQLQRKRLRNCR